MISKESHEKEQSHSKILMSMDPKVPITDNYTLFKLPKLNTPL